VFVRADFAEAHFAIPVGAAVIFVAVGHVFEKDARPISGAESGINADYPIDMTTRQRKLDATAPATFAWPIVDANRQITDLPISHFPSPTLFALYAFSRIAIETERGVPPNVGPPIFDLRCSTTRSADARLRQAIELSEPSSCVMTTRNGGLLVRRSRVVIEPTPVHGFAECREG